MSSSKKLRLLLDTTYLLPMVGVRVKGVEPALEALGRLWERGLLEAYYTPFNILELLGKISRLERYDEKVVEKGLALISEYFSEAKPGVEAYMLALRLRRMGFPDLIDLLLYAMAATRDLTLLTRDKKLIEFLERVNADTRSILPEERLLEEHGEG